MILKVQIDRVWPKCQQCGKCAQTCKNGVFTEENGIILLSVDTGIIDGDGFTVHKNCIGCGECTTNCTEHIFKLIEHQLLPEEEVEIPKIVAAISERAEAVMGI